jgi:hypothetical protein
VASASMRLQRGISLVLLTVAVFILSVELVRHNHGVERYTLAALLAMMLALLVRFFRRVRTRKNPGPALRAAPVDYSCGKVESGL